MLRRSAFRTLIGLLAIVGLVAAIPVHGASQREAGAIAKTPAVDGSDFYMFRSYEPGREDFVTIIANYNPLQDPFAGPAYFPLDPYAFYDIHIINDGDENEDITFRFRFSRPNQPPTLTVGDPTIDDPDLGGLRDIGVPLLILNDFSRDNPRTNPAASRSYTLRVIRGLTPTPDSVDFVTHADSGSRRFAMPLDNVGVNTVSDYELYAREHIHDVQIPGCGAGRVFVGQRADSYYGDTGGLFDQLNFFDILGDPDVRPSSTVGKNVTSIALEVPIDCLRLNDEIVTIAGWTTASLPRFRELKDVPTTVDPEIHFGDLVQVSRVGNPLVSEILIGYDGKDRFNALHPRDDEFIVPYVSHPALPEIFEGFLAPLGVVAPNFFPRNDLIDSFMTGAQGLNATSTQGEVMRLNTALDVVPR
ncbi:MAG: DUF4331 domain-containing protein, partial [Acidobacteriota bacterium]